MKITKWGFSLNTFAGFHTDSYILPTSITGVHSLYTISIYAHVYGNAIRSIRSVRWAIYCSYFIFILLVSVYH